MIAAVVVAVLFAVLGLANPLWNMENSLEVVAKDEMTNFIIIPFDDAQFSETGERGSMSMATIPNVGDNWECTKVKRSPVSSHREKMTDEDAGARPQPAGLPARLRPVEPGADQRDGRGDPGGRQALPLDARLDVRGARVRAQGRRRGGVDAGGGADDEPVPDDVRGQREGRDLAERGLERAD